ncbi:MAG TPA: hypothetical protein VFV10_17220 [Gammaproteobacteria bacterium]|nr:hypothetical protein [Gammaproteobacteria bacterium]
MTTCGSLSMHYCYSAKCHGRLSQHDKGVCIHCGKHVHNPAEPPRLRVRKDFADTAFSEEQRAKRPTPAHINRRPKAAPPRNNKGREMLRRANKHRSLYSKPA